MKNISVLDLIIQTINNTELGSPLPLISGDSITENLFYMMKVAGFVRVTDSVTTVERHVPDWFGIEHLEMLVMPGDAKETHDGLTRLEISKRLFMFSQNEKTKVASNVTFTRPGQYTYTLEK